MAGSYMRGAILQYMETFLLPLPNIIVFQYNPESITHSWSAAEQVEAEEGETANPLAMKGMPGESFSLTIYVDATDTIADGMLTKPLAEISGVYSRLAALEMLLFPTSGDKGLLGSVSVSVSAGGASASAGVEGASQNVPALQAPVALFVWGPGRIVPVRVTGLVITEKIYDGLLNPIHAEVQLEMRVLTPEEIGALPAGPLKEVAIIAYKYSHGLREALAIANLANAAEGIAGMLPF